MQVAINAAAQRHSAFAQDNRAREDGQKDRKDPYIPTPDAAGVAEGYTDFYPSYRWCYPKTYLRFADTLEDTVAYGISDGYSYYMDERDREWLERNNQMANGEGTSASAFAVNGSVSRSSRTFKTKGKEPDVSNVISMDEDEFELIMGLYEKMTDEQHPFLHVVSHLKLQTMELKISRIPHKSLPLQITNQYSLQQFRTIGLHPLLYQR